MKVILLERVEKLGQMGQLVSVKTGYARNFLLPKKKALRATKSNIEIFEKQKAHLEAQNLKRRDEAQHAAKAMGDIMITLIRAASETKQLYGSIRAKDIVDGLALQNVSVARTQIDIPVQIKMLGMHEAKIILHPEVSVAIKINVAQSEEEAAVQEQA
ncbi:MAG: 50S ribosomal protein L9 [Alphaproteobacteria bacterium]|nr:50S ribosomal protein L9 [Alphaproteobacteria bacterium]